MIYLVHKQICDSLSKLTSLPLFVLLECSAVIMIHKLVFLVAVVVFKGCHGETNLEKFPDITAIPGFNRNIEQADLHSAPDFSSYTLVKPRLYHGREKRQISTTKEESGKHIHHLSIAYNVDGKEYILDLQLNKDLIAKDYFRKYQKNGEQVVNRPNWEEAELCHYRGKIRDVAGSWAALSTCNSNHISGVVFDGQDMHYLEKAFSDASDFNNLHFLYKHSDLLDNNKTCGYGEDQKHHITKNHELNRILRYRRAVEPTDYVKAPYNANKQSRYVELILVVDNAGFKDMGENMGRVEQYCKNIANIVNELYAPLNIFIALIGIVVWTEKDEITFSSNGDTTLTNFLRYRRQKLNKEYPNDNAQLVTKFTFENGVVGKALKGPICTFEYSGGINTAHSPVIGFIATTVAHMLGHNFGMEHDTIDCVCPEERCIMTSDSSSVPPPHWSSCSLEYLALAFEHGMDYCLRNKPDSLFGSPVCGNGFVELGEECDCGFAEHCDNICCNATTCKLYSNATCATGECCDLQSCQPKTAGTLCRSADYECDLPEYCTGQSEYCPTDVSKMDSETCEGGKAYCYKGSCRTHSDQCRLLWGETGKSSDDQCYLMNTKGSRHGNCGYNRFNQSYTKCNDEDTMCGMVHCTHLNERLEFGLESVAIISQSFINKKGSIITCRSAMVDLGINQIDPGLTPDGAKCGESKMCVNQKCISVTSIRAAVRTCPNDCNGNGFCNSLGHCHCKEGFAPPLCNSPGFGGSQDSGPIIESPERQEKVRKIIRQQVMENILPSRQYCGKQMWDDYLHTEEEENSIEAKVDEFPWMVTFKMASPPANATSLTNLSNISSCAGFLISHRYVLSAQSCFSMMESTEAKLLVGVHHIGKNISCISNPGLSNHCTEGVKDVLIEKTFSLNINIGLAKLSEDILYSDFVRPICLPFTDSERPRINGTAMVSGWSAKNYHSTEVVLIKQKSKVKIVSDDVCASEDGKIDGAALLCTVPLQNTSITYCDYNDGGLVMHKFKNWFAAAVIKSRCATNIGNAITPDVVNRILDIIFENEF